MAEDEAKVQVRMVFIGHVFFTLDQNYSGLSRLTIALWTHWVEAGRSRLTIVLWGQTLDQPTHLVEG